MTEPFFDASYLDLMEGEPRHESPAFQVAFLVRAVIAGRRGLRVLDHCCGHGRTLRALADLDLQVTGLDDSAVALEYARRQGGPAALIEADARIWRAPDPFDLILSLDASLSCFSRADLPGVLANLHASLVPGGELVVALANPAFARRHMPLRWWYAGRGGLKVLESRDLSAPGLCTLTHLRLHPQPDGGYRETRHALTLTYLEAEETRVLLAAAGFELLQAWGDWQGGPLDEAHGDLIFHLRRA